MIFADDTDGALIPRIPFGDWFDTTFEWVKDTFSAVWDGIENALNAFASTLVDILMFPDAMILAVIFALIALVAKDWKLSLTTLAMLVFVIAVDQWDNSMVTLASILVATLIALIIGIPLGIMAARSSKVSSVVRPVMDLLQTMPALVWLVPVVMLFGTGLPAAVIATLIFCLPPGARLTELGIRQVDSEVVEAGHAFGSTKGQILRRIQLPLAMPTIMAGVNQVIMLALSMAVIAGFVGGGGLGGAVSLAIGSLDIGLGFEAGFSVVALAIFLDRITSAVSNNKPGQHWLTRFRLTRRHQAAIADDEDAADGQAASNEAGTETVSVAADRQEILENSAASATDPKIADPSDPRKEGTE